MTVLSADPGFQLPSNMDSYDSNGEACDTFKHCAYHSGERVSTCGAGRSWNTIASAIMTCLCVQDCAALPSPPRPATSSAFPPCAVARMSLRHTCRKHRRLSKGTMRPTASASFPRCDANKDSMSSWQKSALLIESAGFFCCTC